MSTHCASLNSRLIPLLLWIIFYSQSPHRSSQIWLKRKLYKTWRYPNDIIANINNSNFFKHVTTIYSCKLTLNKVNQDSGSCTFLDLNVSVSQWWIKTKIYDERDNFSLPIVHFLWRWLFVAPSYIFSTLSFFSFKIFVFFVILTNNYVKDSVIIK